MLYCFLKYQVTFVINLRKLINERMIKFRNEFHRFFIQKGIFAVCRDKSHIKCLCCFTEHVESGRNKINFFVEFKKLHKVLNHYCFNVKCPLIPHYVVVKKI